MVPLPHHFFKHLDGDSRILTDAPRWCSPRLYINTGGWVIGSEFTVYALHLKDWRVAALLVVLFFSKIALQCFIIPRIIYHVPYDPICDTAKTHPDVVYFSWVPHPFPLVIDQVMLLFSISIWCIHTSLVVLTAAKWNLVKMGAPVVRLITRDGALTTVSVCCELP